MGLGCDFPRVAIDDATRLTYVEDLPDERRWWTTGFPVLMLRLFKEWGVRVERVMTDNGLGYTVRLVRKALKMPGIRQIQTRPYPQKRTAKRSASSRPC